MQKRVLFIIIFFITLLLGGLWLSAKYSPPPPEPVLSATPETRPAKVFEHDKKIQAEADALLYLFDRMPSVAIYLTDEPIIKSGTNTERGVAYTTCDNSDSPTIYVKKAFYQTSNQKQRVNILKHELTHAFFCRARRMAGHDEEFRRKFAEVGGFGN